MKRVIIVCEGQTEQSFCQNVLSQYFQSKGIVVEAPTIKHSHGGIVPWETLKRQLLEHLHEGDAIVTKTTFCLPNVFLRLFSLQLMSLRLLRISIICRRQHLHQG